ncbi:LysE family translocator [Mesorhizobium sp. ASY16-5R]|uniref:LysE family translocator n=1 Tax=Mesorhizobium sp. ASY16-5R TaxID=3445772 RepID=UPI003F9F0DB6
MDQIVVYLSSILMAYTAFLIAMISPGPNVMAVMGTSMSFGRSQGVALALGISTGSFIWGTLAAVGLSTLLATYALALTVLKIVGGLYLLWLAYKAFRAASSSQTIEGRVFDSDPTTELQHYGRGLTVQMTNPKAALAWIAIISLGLQPDAPAWVAVAIIVGTTLLSILIHLGYALIFSSAPMIRLYAKARRPIQASLGAFYAFAGLKMLTSRI